MQVNILLYAILLLLPLPLIFYIIKCKHYQYCLLPFIALLGIYIFNITGSITVINNVRLFSGMYYFSLLLIVVLFYCFYMIIFVFGRGLNLRWNSIGYCGADRTLLTPLLVSLWGFSFFILFLYYQRHGLPTVFDVSLFERVDIYAIREEKSTNLPEGMQWYSLAFITIPAFIFCYTYILKSLRLTSKAKTIFYLNLPLVLFFSSLTMHKTPYAYLLLYVVIIKIFTVGKSLNIKKLFGYFAIGTGTIIAMLSIYKLNRGFEEILAMVPVYLYRRICVVYTEAFAYVIEIFPSQHDFFKGAAFFPNPGSIFPFDAVNLSQFLGYWIHGILANNSAPSFAQGYANWGFLGFLITVIFMLLQITLIQIFFKMTPKKPIFFAIYVLIVPQMIGYSTESIWSIIDPIFFISFAGILFMYYFSRDVLITLGGCNSSEKQPSTISLTKSSTY